MKLKNILIATQALLTGLTMAASAPTVTYKSATSSSLTYEVSVADATADTFFRVKSNDDSATNAAEQCKDAVLAGTTKTCDIEVNTVGGNSLTENTSYQFNFYSVEPASADGVTPETPSDPTLSDAKSTLYSAVQDVAVTSFDAASFTFSMTLKADATGYQVTYNKDGADSTSQDCTLDGNSCTVASLEAKTKYSFTVAAKNSDVVGEPSVSNDVYTLSANAPTITLTKVTTTTVEFNMESADGFTKFNVQVFDSADAQVGSDLSSVATPQKIESLTAETAYKIKVVAISDDGNYKSVESTQTTTTFAAPPVINDSITVYDKSAKIQWTDAANKGKYKLYYKTGETENVVDSLTELRHYLSGLNAETSYEIGVISYDDATNESDRSAVKTFTTLAAAAAAPTYPDSQLTFDAVTTTSITLNFAAAADDQLVEYYYVAKVDGAAEESGYTANDADKVLWGGNSKVYDSLTAGSTYTFFVIAQNSAGPTKVFKTQQTLFEKMATPTASDATSSSIKLTWTAVPTASKYKIVSNPEVTIGEITDANLATTTITGLTAETSYTFTITALNAEGRESAASDPSAALSTTVAVVLPDSPTNVQVGNIYDTSAKFSWDQVADATGYKLYYRIKNEATPAAFSTQDLGAGQTYFLEKLLTAAQVYEYYIATVKDALESAEPATFETFTTEAAATTVTFEASNIAISEVTTTGCKITLTPVAVEQRVYQYKLSYKADGADFANESIIETDKVIDGLTANTKYTFKVVASNSQGDTAAEKIQWTLPNDVASLTPSEPTANSIKLTWEEVTPNTAITYTIGISPARTDSSVEVTSITGATTIIDSLESDKEYTFTIKAVNTESTLTSAAVFTSTSQYTKPQVQNLQVEAGELKLTVKFDKPAVGVTQICQYKEDSAADWITFTCDTQEATPQSYEIPSLTAGSLYNVKVVLKRGELESEAATANGTPSAASPVAPNAFATAPTAVVDSDTEITLSWTKNDGETYTAYKVYIKKQDGSEPETTIDVSDGNQVSYQFTGLVAATPYQLAVMGINVDQEGPKSDYVDATTQAAPAAPFDGQVTLTIESSTVDSLVYKFEQNLGDGVTYACKYKVSSASDYTDHVCSPASADNTYTISGLTAATEYTVQVIATKDSVSGPEATASKVTLPGTANQPTLADSSLTQTSLTLNWVANDGSITKYKVIQEKAGSTEQTYEVDAPTVTKDISGLTANTAYKFYIQAVNAAGDGQTSTALDVTTFTTDSKVSDITFTNESDADKLVFTFSKIELANIEYTCQYKKTADSDFSNAECTGDGPYTISTLDPATEYTVQVTPRQTLPTVVEGTALSKNDFTKPAQANKPTATVVSDTSIKLSWAANAGSISSYKIYKVGTAEAIHTTADGNTNEYDVSGLTASTAYTFQIEAYNGASPAVAGLKSEASDSVETNAATPPTSFTTDSKVTVTISNPTATSLQFSFDKNLGADVTYACSIKKNEVDATYENVDCSAENGPYTKDSLTATTSYTVKVVATYKQGEADQIIGADATAEDQTFPSKVATPELSEPSDTTLKATWTANADSSITKYKVYVNDEAEGRLTDSATPAELLITGLTPATSYKVQVSAINGEDEGVKSDDSTTQLTKPGQANTPTASNVQQTSLTLTWVANTGTISTYKVYKGEDMIHETTDNSILTFDVTGLTAGTTYQFFVSAVNTAGEGAKSAQLEQQTTAAAPPPTFDSQVENLSITAKPDGESLEFTFTNMGEGIEYTCEIKKQAEEDSSYSNIDCSAAGPYTKSGLESATQYTIRVTPKQTSTSQDGTPKTEDKFTLPAKASTPTLSVKTDTSVTIEWAANTQGTTTGYKVWNGEVPTPLANVLTYTFNDLTASTAYSFYVSALNGEDEGAKSDALEVTTNETPVAPPPPSPPATVEITISERQADSFKFTFTKVEDVTYACTYKSASGEDQTIDCSSGSGPWTISTNLVASTLYTVKVVGTNTAGSTPSTQTATTLPAKGSALTISSYTSSTSFTLNWTKADSALNGYKLYKDDTLVETIGDINTVSKVLDAQDAGSTAVWTITNVNGDDEGLKSEGLTVTLTAPDVKPTLTEVSKTTTEIVFKFAKNVPRATEYTCTYQTGSDAAQVCDVSGAGPNFTITGLTAATSYSIKVKAKNGIGEIESDALPVTTSTASTDSTDPTDPTTPTDPTDPTTPTDPTDPTTPTDPTDPTDSTDPATPTDSTDSTDPATPTDSTDPTTPTDSTDPATPTDSTDPTDPTTPTDSTDPPAPESSAPTGKPTLTVALVDNQARQITYTVNNNDLANQDSLVVEYKVTGSEDATKVTVNDIVNDVAKQTDNLEFATSYEFTAYGKNAQGDSEKVVKTVVTKPDQVQGVNGNPTSTSIQISWSALTGTIKNYKVEVKVATSETWTSEPLVASTATSYKKEGLTAGTEYKVRVSGSNSEDVFGATSDEQTVTTTNSDAAPKAPFNVYVSDITDTTATLKWQKPENSQVNNYIVKNTVTNDAGVELNWLTYTYTITGLEANTEYKYIVSSKNSVDTKGSGLITFKTDKDSTGSSAVKPTATVESTSAYDAKIKLPKLVGVTYHVKQVKQVTGSDGSQEVKSIELGMAEANDIIQTIKDLSEETTYNLYVTYVKDGNTSPTQLLSLTTKQASLATKVQKVEVSSFDEKSVTLRWDAPADLGTIPFEYQVIYNVKGDTSTKQSDPIPSDSLVATITGLNEGTEYEFQVSVQAKGSSTFTAVKTTAISQKTKVSPKESQSDDGKTATIVILVLFFVLVIVVVGVGYYYINKDKDAQKRQQSRENDYKVGANTEMAQTTEAAPAATETERKLVETPAPAVTEKPVEKGDLENQIQDPQPDDNNNQDNQLIEQGNEPQLNLALVARMKGALRKKVNELKEKPVAVVKKDVTQDAPQDITEE